ncbi:MAG: hypothetical protein Q9218_007245, partial [Villophora microphyllina]
MRLAEDGGSNAVKFGIVRDSQGWWFWFDFGEILQAVDRKEQWMKNIPIDHSSRYITSLVYFGAMVAIDLVRESNEQLRDLPPHLSSPTAVFTGATQGIGLATLRQLAIHTVQPTCYIVGRSEPKIQDIIVELKGLNAKGTYIAIQAEVSLLEEVDKACEKIIGMIGEGNKLDILYMSQGYLPFGGRAETKEGLDTLLVLDYYGRLRFFQNLEPLLSQATTPRVVSVLAGGQEGKLYEDDLSLEQNFGFFSCLAHGTTMTSLVFETLAKEHPT